MPATWTQPDLTNPHALPDKARRVREMFSAIAPSYDLNNRLHSLGRDQAWRRAAVRSAQLRGGETVIDVACGTGDLAQAFARAGAAKVIGLDFTFNMLALAQRKSRLRPGTLSYHAADAMCLPLADACADVASIAFGIRNVADPRRAVAEFFRVLRPGGRVVILEFSLPTHRLPRALYQFYFRHILPRTAALIARDRSGAYRYLPRSVNTFLGRNEMMDMLRGAGFTGVTAEPLTLGIAVIYRGFKEEHESDNHPRSVDQ